MLDEAQRYAEEAKNSSIGASRTGDDTVKFRVADATNDNEATSLGQVKSMVSVASDKWIDYTSMGIYKSSTSITGGNRLEYEYNGNTVYRFVPTQYKYNKDVFYSDIGLTQKLASRA